MSIIIAAIKREREFCEARIKALDQLEAEAMRLGIVRNGNGTPAKPAQKALVPLTTRRKITPAQLTGSLRDPVLAAISRHEPARVGEIVESTGASLGRVKDTLAELVDERVIRRVGERAGTRYHLTATLDRREAEAERARPMSAVLAA